MGDLQLYKLAVHACAEQLHGKWAHVSSLAWPDHYYWVLAQK